MGKCALCKTNSIFWNYHCAECEKISHLIALYGPSSVHDLINKTLLVQKDKIDKKSNYAIDDLSKAEDVKKD